MIISGLLFFVLARNVEGRVHEQGSKVLGVRSGDDGDGKLFILGKISDDGPAVGGRNASAIVDLGAGILCLQER